jgi:hypothetical protein
VQLSLDRYGVEKQFRSSKSSDHVRVNPFDHWTDSKIRCQLLSCVIALTVLRLLELKVNEATNRNEPMIGRRILEGLSQLHLSWLWYAGTRCGRSKPHRHSSRSPTGLRLAGPRPWGPTAPQQIMPRYSTPYGYSAVLSLKLLSEHTWPDS